MNFLVIEDIEKKHPASPEVMETMELIWGKLTWKEWREGEKEHT